jgi:predicted SprT family Zn-dependent metalloprotease
MHKTNLMPTEQAYPEIQHAYAHFNARLFGGRLPPVLITLVAKRTAYGYFGPDRYEGRAGDVASELALNPEAMHSRSDRETLSTLVHEMAHAWQHAHGTPSRSGYHNREWADAMERIGLMPSATGAPGGKRTGQSMTHYIVDGGPFDVACAELLDGGYAITWKGSPSPGGKAKAGARTKYVCGRCETQAWGKPDLHIVCGDCDKRMEPAPAGNGELSTGQ